MDAASKRVMWRTLSAISAGRSLVLTTHSMEEADALADRAAVMAKRMLAVGTANELRKKHGDAYHVHVVHKDAPHSSDAEMSKIKSWVCATFPGASTEERIFHGQLRFSVPADRTAIRDDDSSSLQYYKEGGGSGSGDVVVEKQGIMNTTRHASSGRSGNNHGISALFAQLEENKPKLGFEYYSVSQATLDQVFLSIVTKHNVTEENYARAHAARKPGAWAQTKQMIATVYHSA